MALSEAEELELLRLRKRRAMAAQMTHTPSEPMAAIPPAVPPLDLSPEPLTWGQAFQAGRARGGPEEVQAELGGTVTQDIRGNLYWTPEGETQPREVNPPGFDWTDLPRMVGEELPQTAGGAFGAAMGRTLPGMALKAAAGAFGGSMAGEAEQTLRGTQRQPMGEQLGQAAVDAALEGGLAFGGGLLSSIGGPIRPGSEAATRDLMQAIEFAEANPAYPMPLAADIATRTGVGPVPGPTVGSVTRQVEGMTGRLGDIRTDMADAAQRAVEEEFIMPPEAVERTTETLVGAGRRGVEELRERIAAGPGTEAGAYQAREGLSAANREAGQIVTRQYEGRLADAIEAEKPVFDLSPVAYVWKGPTFTKQEMVDTGLVTPQGVPLVKAVTTVVDAIPTATGKLDKIKQILASVDPEQTNFEAIKGLRTIVGDLLPHPDFATFKDNPARRLYAELTEVLKTPKNAAPRYLDEFENANLLTEWRMGLREDDAVRKVLMSKGSGDLVRMFQSNPEAMASPAFRELMDLAPEGPRKVFKDSIKQTLLDSRNPAANIEAMYPASNREPFEYLFDSPQEREAFVQSAEAISRWWTGPVGQLYENRLKGQDTMRFALEQVETPQQARQLWSAMDNDERVALRSALISNTVDAVLKPSPKTGIFRVDTAALEQRMRDMRQSGTWALLDDAQKRRLTGLASYYRTVMDKAGDVGASLENASVAADLKGIFQVANPAAMLKGVYALETILHNRLLANYLTNPKRANRMMARLKKVPRDRRKWAVSAILGAPFVSTGMEELDLLGTMESAVAP